MPDRNGGGSTEYFCGAAAFHRRLRGRTKSEMKTFRTLQARETWGVLLDSRAGDRVVQGAGLATERIWLFW
jgi:hypothetical protein